MAPSGLDALLFDVQNDGVFFFVPLRYEIGVVYQLRVTKDKKYDFEGLCEFLKEKLQQKFYAMFFKLLECELDVGLKIVECDSDLEAMYEFANAYGKIEMIHENRKKDAGNMSYEELVSWVEEETQHLKTPPQPKTISKKVWGSLTPKKSDTGACGSGTNVEFLHKQSNAPESNLNVDESSVPFEFDDSDTSVDDLGRDKIIEEDNIVKDVVDNGKGKMIEEERPIPTRKVMVRNKDIIIKENKNPSVMDSDSSDSEHEMDQIPDYSMLYSDTESEYSDRSIDYLSECEYELIELRKRNHKAKRVPKVSKQKPCSNKECGEGSSRPKTLYDLGEHETVLEHEEFLDDLVRKLRDCGDDAEVSYLWSGYILENEETKGWRKICRCCLIEGMLDLLWLSKWLYPMVL
ncbi:hypothetical protein Tco_0356973 [Tanacetum coccineum]